MNEAIKHELIASIKSFYAIFQKEVLDMIPANNRSGLSPLLYRIIHEIHLTDSINLAELSNRLSVSVPNASRDVRKLTEQGYLQKVRDEKDKRITHLSLTDKGNALVQESLRNMNEIFFKQLDQFQPTDVEHLIKNLNESEQFFSKLRSLNR